MGLVCWMLCDEGAYPGEVLVRVRIIRDELNDPALREVLEPQFFQPGRALSPHIRERCVRAVVRSYIYEKSCQPQNPRIPQLITGLLERSFRLALGLGKLVPYLHQIHGGTPVEPGPGPPNTPQVMP